jgi:hypothetical protein
MTTKKDAEKLLQTARTSKSDNEIQGILDNHWDCFDGNLCEICEYIDDSFLESLSSALASNENTSENTQLRILEGAEQWQGRENGVKLSFAANPKVCGAIKSITLSPDLWTSDDMREEAAQFLEIARNNKAYSLLELAKFEKEFTDEYGSLDD